MTTITKKGATHPRSFENTSAMVLLCAPAPAAPAHSALLLSNFIAPDLVSNLPTPRAHWRQLHIKGRGLFHAYDVQIMKATLRSCQRFGTLSVGNLIAPDLAPSQSTPRAHWRQLPIKGRGLFHAYDVHIRKTTLRSCQRVGTLSTDGWCDRVPTRIYASNPCEFVCECGVFM